MAPCISTEGVPKRKQARPVIRGVRHLSDAGDVRLIFLADNDFLTLDLTKSWQISSPALQGLPQPSGPPPVANGYLWNSQDTLYLYGGEFSDNPPTAPAPYSMWSYEIASSTWKQNANPQTSAGDNSDGGVLITTTVRFASSAFAWARLVTARSKACDNASAPGIKGLSTSNKQLPGGGEMGDGERRRPGMH